MKIKQSIWRRWRVLSLLTALSAFICPLATIPRVARAQKEELKKVLVDLPSLPEPFTDSNLSMALEGATACYNLLGCFEPVPAMLSAQNWPTIGTEFLLYRQNGFEAVVKFEAVENCLSHRPSECRVYPFDLSLLSGAPYKPQSRTIILVSGYRTKGPCDWESRARDLWLELEDVNVIVVNWEGGNNGLYPVATANTRPVSRQITLLLYHLAQLTDFNLSDDSFAEKIYIVGHSLGAHIAGFVGMDLGGNLGRITGLDPAGPTFDQLDQRFRLDRSDARLVDVLHSNAGAVLLSKQPKYGSVLTSGHVDLYANDGVHQPGCNQDILGCSHGKSNKYYCGYLEHELSMRKELKDKYSSLYRLNAYSGQTFESFKNGLSLVERCPKFSTADADLSSRDLNQCTIPVDYFTWYDHLRDELQSHGIDFSPESRLDNRFYFLTAPETDYQMDHYLVQARVSKSNLERTLVSSKSGRSRSEPRVTSDAVVPKSNECDISLTFHAENNLDRKYKFEQYRLIDGGDHYKIIIPYLSIDIVSKYQAAKLDSEHFYLPPDADRDTKQILNITKLSQDLRRVFPTVITLKGTYLREEELKKRRESRENPGFFKSILNYFKTNKDDQDEETGISCRLAIQSFAVQPLRRFHRNFVAFYTLTEHKKKAEDYPKILLLKDGDSIPIESLISTAPAGRYVAAVNAALLELDTVIVGPYDKSLVGEKEEELDLDEILDPKKTAYTVNISSDVAPMTWVALTAILALVIVSFAVVTSLYLRRVSPVDRDIFMSPIVNPNYVTAPTMMTNGVGCKTTTMRN